MSPPIPSVIACPLSSAGSASDEAIPKAATSNPSNSQPGPSALASQRALVVGAGLAGMTAAFYLAEWGAQVALVDRAPHLGGAFLLLDHTFPTDSCGLCLALPRQPSYCPTLAAELHPRIDPRPGTTLAALEGEPGAFVATLRHTPQFVDPARCDGCGACAEVCPVVRPRSGGALPGNQAGEDAPQKAIYPPPPRAIPAVYAIDAERCTRCGACAAACPQAAIDLGAAPSESRVEAGAVLLAPGLAPFDAARAVEYGWGRCAQVLTSLEFERLLHRPRGPLPRRVAFIQCVGSRDERLGRPACSASCCMITAKQVRLLKQAAPEAEVTVYSMDVRASGKGYERYVEQAAALPGVTYRWGRPAAVHQVGTPIAAGATTAPLPSTAPASRRLAPAGATTAPLPPTAPASPRLAPAGATTAPLLSSAPASPRLAAGAPLRVLAPGGEAEYDMVVLAVGLGPAEGVRELAACAGVAVDQDGYVLPGTQGPGSTTRPGVYAAGFALAPADVPEVVTQAAAAAALAAEALHGCGGASHGLARAVEGRGAVIAPASASHGLARAGESRGAVIAPAPALDAPQRIGVFLCSCGGVLSSAPEIGAPGMHDPSVVHVERVEAACKGPGLAAIERAAREQGLNRIAIAGCAPRLYADRFEALMDRLGLPRHLLARVALAPLPPTETVGGGRVGVGAGELAMAVAGLRETPEALPPLSPPRKEHGGEEEPARRVLVLGGGLAGMSAALTLDALGVEVDLLEREPLLGGHLRDRPPTLEGLDGQALLAQTLADLRCAHRQRSAVRVWTGAELVGWSGVRGAFTARIRHGPETGFLPKTRFLSTDVVGEESEERYGALILATGAEPAHPDEAMAAYGYGADPRVMTQDELARGLEDVAFRARLAGASVAMIQCVGSRDEAHPACSRLCCAAAIRNALALKALDPATEVSVLFRDVRTPGAQERYYQQARRLGVHFLRYVPPERPVVALDNSPTGRLRVTVHDQLYDERVTLGADLLVLSTGIAAREPENRRLADLLGVPLDADGFFQEAHPKLRPTDTPRPGIYLCGLAYGPRSIEESRAQARAAALRAALDVLRPPAPRDDVATVVPQLCSFCGLCVAHCPYGARVLDEELRCAVVIESLCQGCGACVAVCPNDASRQPALDPARLLAMVDAAMSVEVSL